MRAEAATGTGDCGPLAPDAAGRQSPRAGLRRRWALGAAAALAAGALGSGVAVARPWIAQLSQPPGAVRGVLLEVVGTGFGAPERITLLDDEGRTWQFRVDPEVATNREQPQSAGHLRQHMAFVDPVLVRYRETPEGPVAVRILDASE